MNFKWFKFAFLALGVSGLITSCGNDNADTQDTDSEGININAEDQDSGPAGGDTPIELDFTLPSSFKVAEMFIKSGLVYESGLTNPIENINLYVSKTEKLLNFGTYSADLCYCVLTEEESETMGFMNNVNQLSESLGLTSIFKSEELVSRFQENLKNKDSLADILVTVQEKLDDYVEENDEQFTHILIFTGAWIESLHFGSKSMISKGDDELSRKLIEQMMILDNLITGLELNPDKDPSIEDLKMRLIELRETFMSFENLKGYESIDDIEDFYSVELSKEEINEISAKISDIRTTIIKG